MKTNWIVAGTAWAGIVALAWWLADRRIKWCEAYDGSRYSCGGDERFDQIITRDNVLLWGGMVPLALFVVLTIAGRAQIRPLGWRWPRRASASRELAPTERIKD